MFRTQTAALNSSFIRKMTLVMFVVLSVVLYITITRRASDRPAIQPGFVQQYGHSRGLSGDDSLRTEYDLYIITDRDKLSKVKGKNEWIAQFKTGLLKRLPTGKYAVTWNDKEHTLTSQLAEGERGMELSELKFYDGKLYTMDDRTGIVYEIASDRKNSYKVLPRYILNDGDGSDTSKGFKCEWATVKDDELYIGSIGKEWTTPKGEIVGYNPTYVKVISRNGVVRSLPWKDNYEAIRKATGVQYPGYMVHEAVEWSAIHKRWFFLPRRAHTGSYDADDEVSRGTNMIISASPDFKDITVTRVGTITPTRGFSTFKFIPGRGDKEIIALKSEELEDDKFNTYVSVFTIDGEVLLEETKITSDKFEGIEII